MKVLVLGGSGLLGRKLCKYFYKNNIEFVATYFENKIDFISNNLDYKDEIKQYKLNVLNNAKLEEEIETIINNEKPTVCINCIVQRYIDICENDWNTIKAINIDLVSKLSYLCKDYGVYLLQISTDYVFDGKKPPYLPSRSVINPLQNYGISKYIAEKRIESIFGLKYGILRVPVLYSDDYKNLSESAVTVIGKKVMNKIEKTKEDNISIRRPVFIDDLCEYIYEIIKTKKEGITHFYNPYDKVTKYEIAGIIGNILKSSTDHIVPVNHYTEKAERPYDTELIDNSYNITDFSKTTLYSGLEKCFTKFKHPHIYDNKDGNIFLLLDLDGTILDTDRLHYNSYRIALHEHDIYLQDFTYHKFEMIINTYNIRDYLKDNKISDMQIEDIMNTKYDYIKTYKGTINFMPGMENLIKKIIENGINYAIVTNTNCDTVDMYIRQLPILAQLENWITREHYVKPKPDSECYKYALKEYYKDEKYIIGFENTINGYEALKNITECCYIMTNMNSFNYDFFKNKDVYLIDKYDNSI